MTPTRRELSVNRPRSEIAGGSRICRKRSPFGKRNLSMEPKTEKNHAILRCKHRSSSLTCPQFLSWFCASDGEGSRQESLCCWRGESQPDRKRHSDARMPTGTDRPENCAGDTQPAKTRWQRNFSCLQKSFFAACVCLPLLPKLSSLLSRSNNRMEPPPRNRSFPRCRLRDCARRPACFV